MTPKEEKQAERIFEAMRPALKKIAIASAQRIVVNMFQRQKFELPEAAILP